MAKELHLDDYEDLPENFGRRQYDMHLQKAQTEIAVLHIKVSNLEDKVEEVRKEISSLKDHIDKNYEAIQTSNKEMRAANEYAHEKMASKVSALEKWRYMLIGAGIILGSFGFEAAKSLFTM